MRKLHIEEYDHPAHLEEAVLEPKRALLPLKQNAGVPNTPLVKAGERVAAGQPLGRIPDQALGAAIHAPFAGVVESVTDKHILLNRV
jgi:Na+-translocating ferredoxin:NAD+ oxidoreductase RnfC subunit